MTDSSDCDDQTFDSAPPGCGPAALCEFDVTAATDLNELIGNSTCPALVLNLPSGEYQQDLLLTTAAMNKKLDIRGHLDGTVWRGVSTATQGEPMIVVGGSFDKLVTVSNLTLQPIGRPAVRVATVTQGWLALDQVEARGITGATDGVVVQAGGPNSQAELVALTLRESHSTHATSGSLIRVFDGAFTFGSGRFRVALATQTNSSVALTVIVNDGSLADLSESAVRIDGTGSTAGLVSLKNMDVRDIPGTAFVADVSTVSLELNSITLTNIGLTTETPWLTCATAAPVKLDLMNYVSVFEQTPGGSCAVTFGP